MLKQIPKSDINLRPFKVYKQFTFTQNDISALDAVNHTGSVDVLSETELDEKGLYHQLYTMYYRDPFNTYTSYGNINPTYTENEKVKQRVLYNNAKVLPIKQKYFGEQIQPKSVHIFDSDLNEDIYDDGYGNLVSDYSFYNFELINMNTGDFWFYDATNTLIKTKIVSLDIENDILLVQNESEFYLLTLNVQDGTISFLGVFKSISLVTPSVGNVFYSHGIITITRETQIGGIRENALQNYDLEYKSTNTIYENEILLVVNEDEFNVSTNPSSYVEMSGSIFQSVEFQNYQYSSSVDVTGSYLTPYITTIGLYDDNMDMVAIAKLATPVKSTPDLPVNFLVRFDT